MSILRRQWAAKTWDDGIESTAMLQTLERGYKAVLRNRLFIHVYSSEMLVWIRI